MKDPARWMSPDSEVDASVRDLLSAAAPPPPMPRDDRESMAAFVAGIGKIAPPVTPWWHAPSLLKTGALVTALVGGGAAVHQVAAHHAARSQRAHVSSPRRASVETAPTVIAPTVTAPTVAAPTVIAPTPATVVAPTPELAPTVEVARGHHHHAAASPEDETALLEDARGDIASGAMGRALRQLARHAQRYPDSVLSEERTFLRVKALVGSGHRGAAEGLAGEYLASHPRGLYAARIRDLIGTR